MHLPESTVRTLENPGRPTIPQANILGLYKLYAEVLDYPLDEIDTIIDDREPASSGLRIQALPKLKSLIIFSNITTKLAAVTVILLVVGYASLQGLNLVNSPELKVSSPSEQNIIVDNHKIDVSGTVKPDTTVLVNGDPVSPNSETNEFNVPVYLQEGPNSITVEAINNFSNSSVKKYNVIYVGQSNSS